MDVPLEEQIDKLVKEIEQLKKDGDPEDRVSDLNEYLRVLYLKLSMTLQEKRWDPVS
jgi:hypothetical protein